MIVGSLAVFAVLHSHEPSVLSGYDDCVFSSLPAGGRESGCVCGLTPTYEGGPSQSSLFEGMASEYHSHIYCLDHILLVQLVALRASRSEVIGASKSKSRAWTLVSCLSAVLVVGEISSFSIGSSCAGLVAGTFGRGYFS